ncbi:MAG TPA: hypothetical protein VFK52_03695 [Nocardioidaceae bacterium]|nr:hypothetical protein [Nocardioidaceae bacterium]
MHLTWPLAERLDLRDRLVAAYSSGRGYHDLQHLNEVLGRLAELGVTDTEVTLAAWYHDAVYDDAGDNEERSAQLALQELAGVDGVDEQEVARLVLVTKAHSPSPDDTAGGALCDADLGILAAPRDRYDDYVAGVRREYARFSDQDFARGRIAVLEPLLAKESIFHTAAARVAWEQTARENLRREIAQLRAVL